MGKLVAFVGVDNRYSNVELEVAWFGHVQQTINFVELLPSTGHLGVHKDWK